MKSAGIIIVAVLSAALLCGCNPKAVAVEQQNIWKSDYSAALEQAANENKYVLVNISGMEWCGFCKMLDSEVFSQPEFIAYAKANLVCVLLDFTGAGRATNTEFAKQHEMLLEKFQVQGFPTVLILNPKGKVIARDGYQRGGPVNYVKFITSTIAADQGK